MSSDRKKRILTVVGARPQFVKAAALSRYLRQLGEDSPLTEVLVHTGQHYDESLSQIFFDELDIATPRYNLQVGSDKANVQIARILERLDPVIEAEQPDAVLTFGDTNSTLAAAVGASRHDIPVIHVEAGERLFSRSEIPEEYNRIVTDHISALCLAATRRAEQYLRREGMSSLRVRFVGDLMYDLFQWAVTVREQVAAVTPETFGLTPGQYHLATIHRPQNTNSRDVLFSLLDALDRSSLPVLLPVHPRVQNLLNEWQWTPRHNLRLVEALGYFDFLTMLLSCQRCFTDSGGVTRESFFAGKPCLLPMENSWWPDLVESGWVLEVGTDPDKIVDALEHYEPHSPRPEHLFGDGNSAKHIVDEIVTFLDSGQREAVWSYPDHVADLPGVLDINGGFA